MIQQGYWVDHEIPKSQIDRSKKHILTISFRNADGTVDKDDPPTSIDFPHPAPDPLLLFAKAAVVWGRMTGVKLLANGDDSSQESKDLVYSCGDHGDAPIPKEITLSLGCDGKSSTTNIE